MNKLTEYEQMLAEHREQAQRLKVAHATVLQDVLLLIKNVAGSGSIDSYSAQRILANLGIKQ